MCLYLCFYIQNGLVSLFHYSYGVDDDAKNIMSRAEPIHIGVKRYQYESAEEKRRERERVQFAYPIKVPQKEFAISLDGS